MFVLSGRADCGKDRLWILGMQFLNMRGGGMKKKIWDLYAPVYEKAMRMDYKYYKFMYDRIPTKIRDKEVLEIVQII